MTAIHTPYHFVPLSKWVHMPEWAHLVSQDHPFSDGYSGVIEYTLTTQTPLCVGSETISSDQAPSFVKFARDPMGNPVVPGTSIKGMLRSVMQVATFGKFSQFDDHRYSYRDISNAKTHYLKNIIGLNKVQAGWLKFDQDESQWKFVPSDFVKVKHKEINHALGVSIDNALPAEEKYKRCPLLQSCYAKISEPKGKQMNRWAEQLSKSDSTKKHGHFVFTHNRIKGMGKPEDYEFSYFFYDIKPSARFDFEQSQVSELFNNHNQDHVNYLQTHAHPELGIPVFALVQGKKVHSFGFAKMPRVGYKYSTADLVNRANNDHTESAVFDFCELIFGTLRDKGLGLRSRVMLSDLTAKDVSAKELYESNMLVLNSPKPTFYPAYVEQQSSQGNKVETYLTYEDNQAQLSGHKRYIIKAPSEKGLTSNAGDNKNVASRIELCPKGKSFSGKIVFHNLKPQEVGALLWCMQLEPNRFHQLGHGKPLGAGAVSLTPKLTHVRANNSKLSALTAEGSIECFVNYMEQKHPSGWKQSPQLSYLLELGNLEANASIDTTYMSIEKKVAFSFQAAKTANLALPKLRELPRKENLLSNDSESTPRFRGRLLGLFEESNSRHETLLELRKQQQLAIAEAAKLAEYEQKMASLSEHARRLAELTAFIEGTTDTTLYPPEIREVITWFIDHPDNAEVNTAADLYRLARLREFHIKPKKRASEQKQQLARLVELYGFSL